MMAGTLRSRNRRNIVENDSEPSVPPSSDPLDMDSPSTDIEIYAKEVLHSLINDNLPPTPNNFSLYFDRLLEDKSENLRKQIVSMLELEESNEAETTIALEHSLKQGFSSVKNILSTTANLYKNMSLMTKILEKRRKELEESADSQATISIAAALDSDINKLNAIVKKQSSQMKSLYDETAGIIKNVENETIFDNKFGVYNRRYLMTKIEQEIELIKEFKHKSSLIVIELSRDLKATIANEKAIVLMTRTIARLLLKTSRRSDIVAHSNSNFFLSDREVQLKISIGITDVHQDFSVEEIVVAAINGVEKAYKDTDTDYAVELLSI